MEIKEKLLKLALIMTVLFSLSIMPILFAEDVNATTTSYEYQVLDLINKERSKVGVTPLKMDKELFNAAKIRTGELTKKFSHTRPDGSSCYTVSSKVMGENIAYGQATPESVMNTWMNSEGHRNNILNPNFKSVGIGYLKGNPSYWVQLFGDKKAELGDNSQSSKSLGTPSLSLATGNKKIILKWKKIPNASGYQIYTKQNGKYVLKKTIAKGNVIQYTDKNLKKKKYYYKIRSFITSNGAIKYSKFSSIKSQIPK